MNFVMIVADTLRRDHLGCYGNQLVRTPNLDALARQSIVLENYYAGSFPTVPARADLLLGKWTFASLPWGPLPAAVPNLPTLLRAEGYRTAAVVDTPFMIQNGYHYDRGFEFFIDLGDSQKQGVGSRVVRGDTWTPGGPILRPGRMSEYDYPTPKTIVTAEQMLEGLHETPFFLYVDTWGSHEPWDPPPYYVRQYKADYDGRVVNPAYGDYRAAGLTEEDLEVAKACYCAEITLVDRWVGRLIERIESLGLAENTIVAFLSDHGFYFGERGQLGKLVSSGRTHTLEADATAGSGLAPVWRRSPLYEELIHVPFMVRVPGCESARVDSLTSAVDVMPTVLDLLTIEPSAASHGRSFAAAARNGDVGGRDFVVSAMPLSNPGEEVRVVDDQMRFNEEYQPATITTRDWSLLFSVADEPVELYDLKADPRQTANVADANPDIVRRLHALYVGLLEEANTAEAYLAPRRESP